MSCPHYDIAVVGAGFSGTMVAAHLMRQSATPIRIALFERTPERAGRGVAYGTPDPCHLLNVPARNMSAFPDDPEHFLAWARRHSRDLIDDQWVRAISPDAFLPRRSYGDYIAEILAEALDGKGQKSTLEFHAAEVTGLTALREGARLKTSDGGYISAGRVVLALGNFHPRDPLVEDAEFYASERYLSDPWESSGFDWVASGRSCLLIGSGLTMVDWVLSLHRRGYTGKIHVLSRRGFWPVRHHFVPPVSMDGDALSGQGTARGLLRQVRRLLPATSGEWRAVLDGLRGHTQNLWRGLPQKEKRRFLRHLRQFWDVHRHRVSPLTGNSIDELVAAGNLIRHIGWLRNCRVTPDSIEVSYRPRGRESAVSFEVDHVVNCSGSESDYRKLDNDLVGALLQQGLARPDPCFLGLETDGDGALLDKDGRASKILFTLGPPQKGVLWETTAVPEIRGQAARLAEYLLASR